jgi:putative heme-binding domain-containing protein
VYVADWCDAQVAHTRNQEGQIDKNNGRIYRLVADGHSFAARDLGKLSSQELVDVLGDANRMVRHTALRLLGDRKDASIVPMLRERLAGLADQPARPLPNPRTKGEGVRAIELLWAIHLSGGIDEETAIACLHHSDPQVRVWTVRLLCDFNHVSSKFASELRELATNESKVEVRSQLACSARRLPATHSLPIVRALLTHSDDADDPRLPLLLWWAIEAKCDSDRPALIALFGDHELWSMPIVERHLLERLMRRFAAAGTRGDLVTCSQLLKLAPADDHRKKLMAGFEAAYAGRSVANLPEDLLAAIDQFAAASPLLGLRQGKPEAVDLAAKTILDDKADVTARLQYVQVLGEVHQPVAVPALLQLAVESSDSALRSAAMLALRRYDDSQIPASVLAVYPKLTEDERAAALRLLVSRGASAHVLLGAVEHGQIDPATVPADVLLELQWRPEEAVKTRVKKLFPHAGRVPAAELKEEIVRLQSVVAATPGTPKVGRELFAQHCAKCHTLFGKGGVAGPELTTYPRQDTTNLLLHIVDPNTAIREGYLTSVVAMVDGRTLAGVIADQDNQTVVLRGSDGKDMPLARSQIEDIQPAPISLMPEGLLRSFNDEQVRDLFAYLRSSQPVIDH